MPDQRSKMRSSFTRDRWLVRITSARYKPPNHAANLQLRSFILAYGTMTHGGANEQHALKMA